MKTICLLQPCRKTFHVSSVKRKNNNNNNEVFCKNGKVSGGLLFFSNVMGAASQQAEDLTGYDRLKLILQRGDALLGKRVFTRRTRSFPNMVERQKRESPDRGTSSSPHSCSRGRGGRSFPGPPCFLTLGVRELQAACAGKKAVTHCEISA